MKYGLLHLSFLLVFSGCVSNDKNIVTIKNQEKLLKSNEYQNNKIEQLENKLSLLIQKIEKIDQPQPESLVSENRDEMPDSQYVIDAQIEKNRELSALNETLAQKVEDLSVLNKKLAARNMVKPKSQPKKSNVRKKLNNEEEIREMSKLLYKAQKMISYAKYENALEQIVQVLKKDSSNPRAWKLKGTVNYLMGNFESARVNWGKTLSLDPYDTVAKRYLEKAIKKVEQENPSFSNEESIKRQINIENERVGN